MRLDFETYESLGSIEWLYPCASEWRANCLAAAAVEARARGLTSFCVAEDFHLALGILEFIGWRELPAWRRT